jgi:hypothetical protein
MRPREQFLLALFRSLDRKAVPYCVQRNYANLYEDTSSDIDVAVEPEHVLEFKGCLAEAAAASDHHLVLRARYVNYSYVYWHAEGGFVRIDVETEVRWRVFPVLTAKAVVGLRRREGAFYIPHPRHESAILWVAAIWRGELSGRYRNQLAQLWQQAAYPGEFERTFSAAFGAIGPELAACQSRIGSQPFDARFWKRAKRSIVRNAFRDRPCRRALRGYLDWDAQRLWERIRYPRGISLLYASAAQPGRDLLSFFQQIQFLYPIQKSDLHSFAVSPVNRAPFRGLGLRLRARRLFVLFKGGLFMRFYRLSCDSDIARVIRTHPRYLFPSRTFIWTEDSRLHTCLGHVDTGFMAELDSLTGTPISTDQIVRFIAAILQQYPARGERRSRRRGAFVVMAGLDASGRSAVARNLCSLALAARRFHRVCYLRWPPRLKRKTIFPLRELNTPPDRPQPAGNPPPSRLPTFYLCKNLLLAQLNYWLRVRRLVRRNSLVLFDGYGYAYERLSDVGAVKNSGPARLLARLLSLYPRPDLVVVLKAPAAASPAGHQAPSKKAALLQTALFEQLRLDPQRILRVDASSPPLETARGILQKITAIVR